MQLNEITHWGIEVDSKFKTLIFSPSDSNNLFRVILYNIKDKEWILKYGNKTEENDEGSFEWKENDPEKLHKMIFIKDVLKEYIIPSMDDGSIERILFSPFEGDGLSNKRLELFNNIFKQLNNGKCKMFKKNDSYVVEKIKQDFDLKEYLVKHKLTRNSKDI